MIVDKGEIAAKLMTDTEPDTVEVIRCLNCKYLGYTIAYRNNGEYSYAEQVPFCDKLRRETEPWNYCSWAEPYDA